MSIAKNCRIFIDGADLAGALTDLKTGRSSDSIDNTTLGTTGDRTYEPGLRKGSLSMSGIFDADTVNANKIDDILSAALAAGSDLIFTASLGEIAVGGPALMAKGAKTKYEVSSPLGQLVVCSAEVEPDGSIQTGKFLFDGTATSALATGVAVDNAASSNKGGILHAHLFLKSDSSATNGSFTLQHSADNAVWVDLVAATAVGASKGAITVKVAADVTINRYLRILFTATGGKAYAAAAFKRL